MGGKEAPGLLTPRRRGEADSEEAQGSRAGLDGRGACKASTAQRGYERQSAVLLHGSEQGHGRKAAGARRKVNRQFAFSGEGSRNYGGSSVHSRVGEGLCGRF